MRKLNLIIAAASLFAVMASPTLAEDIAITNGRIITMGDAGTIEGGTILIADGVIEAVGMDVTVPDGYRIIDAGGMIVTPGLMNAYTMLGILEIGLESATNDNTINSPSPFARVTSEAVFSAAFDVSYGINPKTMHIPIQRIEGLTRALVAPGTGSSIFAGQASVIDLSGDFDSITATRVAMVVSLGEAGKARAGGARGGLYVTLIRALNEALNYGRRGEGSLAGRERDSILSLFDAEALVPVVEGDMPLIVHVSRAAEILQVLALSHMFGELDLILSGAREGWMVADEIAAAGVSVILDPHANLPSSFEALASTLYNAGRLSAAGVTIAFRSPDGDVAYRTRLVRQGAGNAVAHGMDWDAALAAITINPARMFGIDESYGTLETGKDADVVVWDGDPLELMTNPVFVAIKGVEMVLESRQTRLRDRYMDLDDQESRHQYR